MESAEDQLYIKLVRRGAATLEQNGVQRRFNTDSLVVVDPARPFVEMVDEETHLIVVTCPKAALRERGYRSQFDHWTAPDLLSPDVQLVQAMIMLIAGCYSTVSEETRAKLGGQLLDLMDVLLTVDTSVGSRTGAAIRFRVKQHIAKHLGDASLDATAIATGVRISVSHLNRVFRDEETSLMRYLWNQRLERAHDLLRASPSSSRIEDIAWRCGFSSAAHFSRLFKQRYGQSPRGLRDNSG